MARVRTRVIRPVERLDNAMCRAMPIPQISSLLNFTLADAYRFQRRGIGLRQARGETVVGVKLGFTSRAKMKQMGLDQVICGHLTSGMNIEDGGQVSLSRFIHPRAEPELAFRLRHDLGGRVTVPEAMDAVESVACAIELIDSRYRDFKFTLPDVVADNCSSAGFCIGSWQRPDFDFGNLGMLMQFNGRVMGVGSSAALLGHPARTLVAAARLFADLGMSLKSGWIVMAGSPMAAQALQPGMHVCAEVEGLGQAEFTTTD